MLVFLFRLLKGPVREEGDEKATQGEDIQVFIHWEDARKWRLSSKEAESVVLANAQKHLFMFR